MQEFKSEYKMTIPFYDVDEMQIVWHGNYVKYLEDARCDFLKKINYSYNDMKKDGMVYPVAKMDMKFIDTITFSQEITIKTILKEIEPAIIFKYIICDTKTDKKLFTANSMQIGV